MDMERQFARMLAPLTRRLRLMVARAVVTAIGDAGKIQSAQVKLLDGEVRDGIEILHQYGFTSIAHGQPEGLYFSVGADRDHGVMICVAERAFRLKSLAPGEVAIYDDLGQKVHLTRTGIVVDGGGMDVTIQNAPIVHVPQDLKVGRDIIAGRDVKDQNGGKSMAGMRAAYNGHNHGGAGPNQGM